MQIDQGTTTKKSRRDRHDHQLVHLNVTLCVTFTSGSPREKRKKNPSPSTLTSSKYSNHHMSLLQVLQCPPLPLVVGHREPSFRMIQHETKTNLRAIYYYTRPAKLTQKQNLPPLPLIDIEIKVSCSRANKTWSLVA